MTDQVCRNFCVNTATGHPFTYFGISNGRNCYCGNTPPATVAGLPNESLCTTPNSGDPTQAGGGPNAINAWLASPIAGSASSGLPGVLPSGNLSVSLPGGLPSGSGLPSVTLPGSVPSGVLPSGITSVPGALSSGASVPGSLSSRVSVPGGGLPGGAAELSSLLSVIGGIPSSLLPSGLTIATSIPPSGLPSGGLPGGGDLSSLLSAIGGIPSSLLPSGFTLPTSIPPTGLPSSGLPGGPAQISSLLSVIGGIPSSLLPSGFTIATSIPPSGLPSGGLPGGGDLSSLLSVIGGIPSSLLPSGFTVPTPVQSTGLSSSRVPSQGDLSSLLSVIGGIPSSLLPSGFTFPTSVPPTGLPGGVSSLLSVIGGIPSSAVPSGLPGAVSSIFGNLPSASVGGGLSGGVVSTTSTTTVMSTPLASGQATTQGTPLPAVTPVADPSLLVGTADPAARFLGCLASTGLNGAPVFNGPSIYDPTLTQTTCNTFCNTQPGGPYRFYALEQGNLCHCSQTIDTTNVITDQTGCNMAAAGDPTQRQNGGGRGRLATFQNLGFPNTVRPHLTIVCSKLALHKCFYFAKVGIG
jgi:hypothetical protein